MGCGSSSNKVMDPMVNNTHFNIERVVGEGGFGKVNAATRKRDNKWFAIKKLKKAVVVKNNSAEMLMNERNLLALVSDPFIINMHYAYQDDDHCYLVMDLCLGGDLRYQLRHATVFPASYCKFFMASTMRGIKYLHSKRILHRDIKPDNAVMDSDGYVRFTDLGISVLCEGEGKEFSTTKRSGTKAYMPPEMFTKNPVQTATADYWMMGIMMHEFVFGTRPWGDASGLAQYVSGSGPPPTDYLQLDSSKAKERPSDECKDFMKRLLDPCPRTRMGAKGWDEVVSHPYWAGFDWDGLEKKTLKPPFMPDVTKANCDTGDKDLQEMFGDEEENKGPKLTPEQQMLFKDYNFNDDPENPFSQKLSALPDSPSGSTPAPTLGTAASGKAAVAVADEPAPAPAAGDGNMRRSCSMNFLVCLVYVCFVLVGRLAVRSLVRGEGGGGGGALL